MRRACSGRKRPSLRTAETGQSLQGLGKSRCGGEDFIPTVQSVACQEVVDLTPGLLDQHDPRSGVPGIDVTLPVSVEPPGRGIGEPKRPGPDPEILAPGGKKRIDRADMIADRPPIAEADTDAGAFDVRLAADLDSMTIQKRTPGLAGGIKLGGDRVVDDPEHQFAIHHKANRNAP